MAFSPFRTADTTSSGVPVGSFVESSSRTVMHPDRDAAAQKSISAVIQLSPKLIQPATFRQIFHMRLDARHLASCAGALDVLVAGDLVPARLSDFVLKLHS